MTVIIDEVVKFNSNTIEWVLKQANTDNKDNIEWVLKQANTDNKDNFVLKI